MPVKQVQHFFKTFVRLESAGGLLLLMMTLLALYLNNTATEPLYTHLVHTAQTFHLFGMSVHVSLLHFINDFFMAIFFLLVGLEMKREFLVGALQEKDKRTLPFIAAIGGMVVPALLYVACTYSNQAALQGWAIPTATDIAFALGVLALFGTRAPIALKVFLTALAILDDLGAIVIIALFYAQHISVYFLLGAAVCLVLLWQMNRRGVRCLGAYLFLGVVLWAMVLGSGVHATLAGVLLAWMIPLDKEDATHSPLHRLEHALHPWVVFLILPLFAFVNAGLSFHGFHAGVLLEGIPLGITLGLLLGKPLGILGFSAFGMKKGWARLPEGLSWSQFAGGACLCGIGFTMSLFVGTLAFGHDGQFPHWVRMGVFLGSLLSAVAGGVLLGWKRAKG